MGSKNGTPKWSPKMAPKKGVKMQIKSWFLLLGTQKNGTQKGTQYLNQEEIKTLFAF